VNILFIWSKNNPTISYIQGMNEVAASVVYVYYKECLGKDSGDLVDDTDLGKLAMLYNDVQFAEADIYSLFQKIMNDGSHMEMFRPNYTGKLCCN
jgi:TBC1 domain family member 5